MARKEPLVAILVGDAHLSDRSFVGRSDMVGDPQYAFTQITDLALRLKAEGNPLECVVAAGDLLHSSRPTSRTTAFLRQEILRLKRQKIRFCFIRGNHDYDDPPWPKAVADVEWIDGKTIKAGPLTIHGCDYRPADSMESFKELQACDILVCHQRWDEFAGSGLGDGSLELVRRNDIRLVFTGDMHQYRKLVYGEQIVLSPGATHMRKSDEPDEHFVVGVSASLELVKYRLKSRKVIRREIDSEESLCGFIDNGEKILTPDTALPADLQRPVAVLRLSYLQQKAKRRLIAACRNRSHLFLTTIKPEEVATLTTTEESATFLELLRKQEDKEAVALLEQLWNSDNPKERLPQLVKEKGL